MDFISKKDFPTIDFKAGATLLVNKPMHWTSFDVVNKLRGAIRHHLGVKKIKVGHSGTLDPMATGLLIICTGKFTKKLNEFQDLGKVYTGTITFGGTTPTYDKESDVDTVFPFDHITKSLLLDAIPNFTGKIAQIPPMFSAIKIKGQPLYKLARRGEKIELKPRNIEIYSLKFTRIELPEVDFEVHCSKGTYIRSLAHDLGQYLNSGAHLSKLVRTKVGDFTLEHAWDLPDLVDEINKLERVQS